MSGPGDRTEVIRRDHAACKGNGFTTDAKGEHVCEGCGGTGMEERRVPYRHEGYTQEAINEIFDQPAMTSEDDLGGAA